MSIFRFRRSKWDLVVYTRTELKEGVLAFPCQRISWLCKWKMKEEVKGENNLNKRQRGEMNRSEIVGSSKGMEGMNFCLSILFKLIKA